VSEGVKVPATSAFDFNWLKDVDSDGDDDDDVYDKNWDNFILNLQINKAEWWNMAKINLSKKSEWGRDLIYAVNSWINEWMITVVVVE
jgi:hypothetical protein